MADVNPAAPAPAATALVVPDAEAAKKALMAPAIVLAILAGLMIVLWGVEILAFVTGAFRHSFRFEGVNYWKVARFVGPAVCLFAMALNALILFGAVQMMRLRSWGFAMAAAIVAMIPISSSACCIFTLPVGIWALMVLKRPLVKASFP
jgi:hypothetical protein